MRSCYRPSLERAVWVTSIRMRREDRSSIVVSSSRRPRRAIPVNRLRHDNLLASICSFVRLGAVPSSRPAHAEARRAQGLSRLAVAMTVPLAPVFAGHALTGLSTARRSSRSGRIGFDALESATLVEDCPSDTGELVGERDRQHIAVQALLCRLDP